MRLRFDRYQDRRGRLQWTSVVLLVFGGIGVALGTLSLWLGVLMIVMTDGGIWERRAGVFLSIFTGLFPLAVSGVMIWRGISRRRELGALRDLAALARQKPEFAVDEVARALDMGPVRAHRLVVDALSSGMLEETAPAPHALTSPAHVNPMGATVAVTPAPAPAPGGSWVGRTLHDTYRVDAPLASGGMGQVYRATHLRTGRSYALKTMLPDARVTPDALRRFEREATAASAIGHPNIIGVHDFNVTPDGAYYMVMDLLDGETLEQRLQRVGSLAWGDAQKIALELASALGAAHAHGLLHRDLKPANVFLARAGGIERAVLLDFGLVKPMDDAAVSRITATGAAIGTPMYMSPEQARGDALDARSDVYGLAAVLYEAVTGAPPFLDRTLASVYARLLTTPPPVASTVSTQPIPPSVDALLEQALAKDPKERFADMRALTTAIESVPATLEVRARA